MKPEDVVANLKKALQKLFAEDYLLLDYDANERSITHKIAEHMSPLFGKPFNVDCEYNRFERNPKYVEYPVDKKTDDTNARTVYPDIIVHERGEPNNLLVIEVKRSTNKASWETDLAKLADIASDQEYAYSFGVFLNVSTGDDTEPSLWAQAIWFIGGIQQNLTTIQGPAYTRQRKK